MSRGRDETSERKPDMTYNQSVERGMEILEVILEAGKPLRLDRIVKRTGLPKATVYRLLKTLESREFVVTVPSGFWLGLKLLRLGAAVSDTLDLKVEAHGELLQLRDRCRETVHLAVLDDEFRVVYVDKIAAPHAVGLMMSRVGVTAPSYCTGLGKALLAFADEGRVRAWLEGADLQRFTASTITEGQALVEELERIRNLGYSTDFGEHEEAIRCVAAPIYDHTKSVVGAISLAGPESRVTEERLLGDYREAVLRAAQEISRRLGYVGPGQSASASARSGVEHHVRG